ncbi:MAG: autotransporter outer membrane beta-barrel domain-containing protein [Aphanocapsa feldmannii 277cV]|uniref:Autotransporter outer membrane beta-barrel domain-containing protein n=1 Tax=Aphanocapsa feldmannii 277cV TaxID=2507553 RepID=A0A524RNP3_9CHRO|nr:MAG: autotransporter outer membrane beta-barrel domain-containing protein [Aphanocapsa feldmannii 277cV]
MGVASDSNNATATGTIVDDDMATAKERQNRVNEEVLPKVTQAIAVSTLSAITGRIDSVVSGTMPGEVNLTSVSSLYHTLKSNEQALNDGTFNLAQVPGGSSFLWRSIPAKVVDTTVDQLGGSGGVGQRRHRKLSGDEDSGVEWDGNVFSFHLGMDVPIPKRPDLLAGFSVSRSLGSFDYIDRSDPVEVEGSYRSSMTGIHPYVNWSLPQGRVNLWATAGYGWGEIEIDDDIGGVTSSDTTMQATPPCRWGLWAPASGCSRPTSGLKTAQPC